IERLARVFVSLGAVKLRLTGGEPLVRAQLGQLVARLSALEGVSDLALTTNGSLLGRHAEDLAAAGLKRVTVSLDSLDPEVFGRMSGRGERPEPVLAGIAAAQAAGLVPIKINCVVQRGVNDHTLVDLAEHFKGTGHVVRYIEYMDVGTRNGWNLSQVVSAAEIVSRIHDRMPLEQVPPSYPGEVARRYRYLDGTGEIGVISSVSEPFCGDCTRARLTTDGRLVTCLFASGGTDLRGPLRAGACDEDLADLVEGVWLRRNDRYSEERSARTSRRDLTVRAGRRIEMYQLGG
ncbi:MAG: GTP 3',8-cyclase MoaA, partial [Acidimicrobiia bacterium]